MVDSSSTKKPLSLAGRIHVVMEHFGLSQNALAKLVLVSQSNVHAWLNGGNISEHAALAFEVFLKVRREWIKDGKGKMLLDDMGTLSPSEVRLIEIFRHSDIEAREEIISQAEFQLGRSKRRGDRK